MLPQDCLTVLFSFLSPDDLRELLLLSKEFAEHVHHFERAVLHLSLRQEQRRRQILSLVERDCLYVFGRIGEYDFTEAKSILYKGHEMRITGRTWLWQACFTFAIGGDLRAQYHIYDELQLKKTWRIHVIKDGYSVFAMSTLTNCRQGEFKVEYLPLLMLSGQDIDAIVKMVD